jgi:uncharacterized protein (TIGR02597 family)
MKTKTSFSLLLAACFLPLSVRAEDSATVPEGFVKVPIQASPNGSAYSLTQFFAPLHRATNLTGRRAGSLSAVGSNTLSDGTAGWSSGGLAAVGSPYFVNITSGTAEGVMFQITANTDSQVTLNTLGQNLSSLGVVVGDTYEILPGHTLLGIVGSPASGVVGGTAAQFNASQTDKILVNDTTGATRFYYFDTGASQWRTVGSGVNQSNLVISPKAGLVYYRISTAALSYVFYGEAAHTDSLRQVPATGTTIVAPYFPQDATLASLGLHLMPGWRKLGDAGVVLNSTDRVSFPVSGVVLSFYHDGTSWKRVGSGSIQNSQILPAGSSAILTRFGTVGQSNPWSQPLPYNLD